MRATVDLDKVDVLIGIALGAIGVFLYLKGALAWFFEKIKKLIRPSSATYDIPNKTLILLQPQDNAMWWHMGTVGKEPAMQIVGDMRVTNISRYNILLSAVKLKRPKVIGHAGIIDHAVEENGEFLIPENGTCRVRFHCWVVPPVKQENQDFVTDIALIDQYGNEHWMKKVKFTYK